MTAGFIAEAAGLFAVTNLDDIVILSLFFAQGAGQQPGSSPPARSSRSPSAGGTTSCCPWS
jgi:hypothetical protein